MNYWKHLNKKIERLLKEEKYRRKQEKNIHKIYNEEKLIANQFFAHIIY